MAALEEAAARNGTTVSELLRQGAEQVADPAQHAPTVAGLRRLDPQSGLLVALLTELDGLGIGDVMPEARRQLDRARQLQAGAASEVHRARDGRAVLVERLAGGDVGAAEAAQRDVEYVPWLDGERPALRLAERAISELTAAARRSAVSESVAVHQVLVDRINAAVDRAVEAGGRVVDVPKMVRLLSPIWQRRGQSVSGNVSGTLTADPWTGGGPKLPPLTMDDLQGDPERLAAWATSTAAMVELDRLWPVADMLGEVCGWSFVRWGKDVSKDVLKIVEDGLPRPVWYAVIAGCGWRPSLIMAAGQLPTSPPDHDARVRRWGASALGVVR
ncbi:hypothetical protein [Plantactinospora sp. WMMB782]|uniref:hypothetical protein n=1 Tax=Plantactinospora sp. WMMB782 TaxID=3404121 RepID=UPI003B92873C